MYISCPEERTEWWYSTGVLNTNCVQITHIQRCDKTKWTLRFSLDDVASKLHAYQRDKMHYSRNWRRAVFRLYSLLNAPKFTLNQLGHSGWGRASTWEKVPSGVISQWFQCSVRYAVPKTGLSLSSLSLASTNGIITEIKGDVLKFMAMQQRSEFCPNVDNDDNLEHNPAPI